MNSSSPGRSGLPAYAILRALNAFKAWCALLAAVGLFAACGDDSAGGPVSEPAVNCAELSDSLFPVDGRSGLATFMVVAPQGGAFKVGSEMKVVVSGVDYTSALVDMVVFGAAGGRGRIPGVPANKGIKPREECVFRFSLPESLTTNLGKRISLVSDSVKVIISDYSDPLSLDYSDSFFSIAR